LGRGPVFIWLQDLWPESLSATGAVKAERLIRIARFVTAIIHRNADLNLVSCNGFAERLQAMGVSPCRIRYLPNYAEDIFREKIKTQETDSSEPAQDIFKVMFAGNIGEAQDFPTILSAAELLKSKEHIQWWIVGEGRAAAWLQEEVVRRGLQDVFHLAGIFPVEQMPKWFASADVMLATLRSDPIFALTLPSKIQSYMAASKPIVAALDGEAALILNESQCGICVRAGNARELAEAVLKISCLSPEELRRLGQNGRAYFDTHFERQRLITQLEEWMQAAGSVKKAFAGSH
jgi:colanic acid biosynthesis glycosyl transferase WcaI